MDNETWQLCVIAWAWHIEYWTTAWHKISVIVSHNTGQLRHTTPVSHVSQNFGQLHHTTSVSHVSQNFGQLHHTSVSHVSHNVRGWEHHLQGQYSVFRLIYFQQTPCWARWWEEWFRRYVVVFQEWFSISAILLQDFDWQALYNGQAIKHASALPSVL